MTTTSVQRTTSGERELMLGANERAWGFTDSESIDLHCECGRVACPDITHVARRTHERLGTERVTETGDGYAVVKGRLEEASVSTI